MILGGGDTFFLCRVSGKTLMSCTMPKRAKTGISGSPYFPQKCVFVVGLAWVGVQVPR